MAGKTNTSADMIRRSHQLKAEELSLDQVNLSYKIVICCLHLHAQHIRAVLQPCIGRIRCVSERVHSFVGGKGSIVPACGVVTS